MDEFMKNYGLKYRDGSEDIEDMMFVLGTTSCFWESNLLLHDEVHE